MYERIIDSNVHKFRFRRLAAAWTVRGSNNPTDRQRDGRKDGQTDRQTDGRSDGRMDGQTEGRTEKSDEGNGRFSQFFARA